MKDKFSIKELAKVLKLCKNSNVTEIKLGDLHIVLGESEKPLVTVPLQARGAKRKAKKIADKSELQESFDAAQEFTETLHLEDPAAYERAVIEGELGEETVSQ